jgi:hypothetical protein
MALNVSSFRSQLKGGGARPSLFRIRCLAPQWVNFPVEKFTYLASAASLPASQIGEKIIPYMGQDIKFAGDRTYPDYTITVYNDEDFLIRNAFEKWNNGISQYSRTNAVRVDGATADPVTYVGKISIDQIGKEGEVIKTYDLLNAWPAYISDIQLAWDQKDNIEQFSVSFRYDSITSVGVTT